VADWRGEAAASPVTGCIRKQVKILHKNALFFHEIFTIFLGRGHNPFLRPHFYPFVPFLSNFWIRRWPPSTEYLLNRLAIRKSILRRTRYRGLLQWKLSYNLYICLYRGLTLWFILFCCRCGVFILQFVCQRSTITLDIISDIFSHFSIICPCCSEADNVFRSISSVSSLE